MRAMPKSTVWIAVVATTVLAACGGGRGTPGATPTPTAATSPSPAATHTATPTPAPTPSTVPPVALSARGIPSARLGASMGYDPVTRRVILFGGWGQLEPTGTVAYRETWAWDGSRWTLAATGAGPTSPVYTAMGLDPLTGRIALAGGLEHSQGPAPGPQTGLWEWDGRTWLRVPGGDPPLQMAEGSLVGDLVHHVLVLTGWTLGEDGVNRVGSFAWDGHTWRTLPEPREAPPSKCAGSAFDPISGRVVQAAGGYQQPGNDTRVFDGVSWHAVATAATLPYGAKAAATDSTRGQIVMLGASMDFTTQTLPTTWTWDGGNWVRHIVTEPPQWLTGMCGSALLADDPAVQRVVAYVVVKSPAAARAWSSMWSWDGSDWTRILA